MSLSRATLLLVVTVLVACGEDRQIDAPPIRSDGARYDGNGSPLGRAVSTADRPNLVIVVVDTLRADAVMGSDTSPVIMPYFNGLLARGAAFTRTFSTSARTVPAMTSLLTGLMPQEHRCTQAGQIPRLPAAVVTYPEILRSAYGYETAVFTDMKSFRRQPWSILQGFAQGSLAAGATLRSMRPMERGFGFAETAEVLDDWLSVRDAARPFCLLLHAFDAHDPYGPENRPTRSGEGSAAHAAHQRAIANYSLEGVVGGREFARQFLTSKVGREKLFRQYGRTFAQTVATYMVSGFDAPADAAFAAEMHDAYNRGVRWVDKGLEFTISALKERGLLENTLLVVTADHGEAFGEHGTLNHGHQLHAEIAHVPMVMLGPGPFGEVRPIESAVSLLDVFPTFFDWAGIEGPVGARGRSLLPTLRGEHQQRVVESEARVTDHLAGPGVQRFWVSRRSKDWSFLICYDISEGTVREQLYRGADIAEIHDLAVAGRVAIKLPDSFCKAVEGAREIVWAEVASAQDLAGTVYGAGIEVIESTRPKPCIEAQ